MDWLQELRDVKFLCQLSIYWEIESCLQAFLEKEPTILFQHSHKTGIYIFKNPFGKISFDPQKSLCLNINAIFLNLIIVRFFI